MVDQIVMSSAAAEVRREATVGYEVLSDSPLSIIKVEVYRYIAPYRKSKELKVLKKTLIDKMETKIKVKLEENPFFWAFRSLENEKDKRITSKFHPMISELALQLRYAHIHGVPAELLIGFLHQVGGKKGIYDKLDRGARETWFKKGGKWRKFKPPKKIKNLSTADPADDRGQGAQEQPG